MVNRGGKSYSKILRTDPVRREFHVDPPHDLKRYRVSAYAEIYVFSRSFELVPGARALRNAASVDPSPPSLRTGLRAVICVLIACCSGNTPSMLVHH